MQNIIKSIVMSRKCKVRLTFIKRFDKGVERITTYDESKLWTGGELKAMKDQGYEMTFETVLLDNHK